jgi:hypothetical protein
MATLNVNVSDVEPQRSFEPLPAGTYTAEITDSGMNETRAGNGHYLKLEFTILDGPDGTIGRKVWSNLNLDNPNKTAVEIAYSELSSICHAIGHNGNVQDSEELHGTPMEIDVTVRGDETGKYQPSNEIRGYRPASGSTPAAGPAASAAPPWAKQAG